MNPTEPKSSSLTNVSKQLGLPKKGAIFTQKINVEPNQMGYVLSSEMPRKVSHLKKMYQVEITLPVDKADSQIIIKGQVGMVFAARSDIEESVPCTTSFFIEKDFISLIIGCKRETIRTLAKEFNVKIDIKEGGEVEVNGNSSGCKASKKAIESLIEHRKNPETLYQEKFYVPGHLIAQVRGENGSNARRIEAIYSVYVNLPTKNEKICEIVVKGSSAQNVSTAKKDILKGRIMVCFAVDARLIGKIIGRRGETICRLRKDYGVTIDLKEGKVYIWGMKSRAETARNAIRAILSGNEKKKTNDASSSWFA